MEPSVLSRSRMTGKKTVNSRRIMAAVMVIVMLAALTGCVGKEDTQTRKKNKVVEIPMILTVDSSTGNKNEEEVVERFNRAYKGKYHIDVDWVMETEEEYRKKMERFIWVRSARRHSHVPGCSGIRNYSKKRESQNFQRHGMSSGHVVISCRQQVLRRWHCIQKERHGHRCFWQQPRSQTVKKVRHS